MGHGHAIDTTQETQSGCPIRRPTPNTRRNRNIFYQRKMAATNLWEMSRKSKCSFKDEIIRAFPKKRTKRSFYGESKNTLVRWTWRKTDHISPSCKCYQTDK